MALYEREYQFVTHYFAIRYEPIPLSSKYCSTTVFVNTINSLTIVYTRSYTYVVPKTVV